MLTFTLTSGATVDSELHVHVSLAETRQTTMHFKNGGQQGRELPSSLPIAAACEQEVRSFTRDRVTHEDNKFPGGYKL